MFDPTHFVDGPDGSAHASCAGQKKLALDHDGSGHVDGLDCPFPPGSAEAKKWFYETVDPQVHQVNAALKAKYGEKCTGMFNGKPLIPGVKGSATDPQGDFDYMIFQLQTCQGVSEAAAQAIALKALSLKYPIQ